LHVHLEPHADSQAGRPRNSTKRRTTAGAIIAERRRARSNNAFYDNTDRVRPRRRRSIAQTVHAAPRNSGPAVFANNRSGIDDNPLRASDGGAISFSIGARAKLWAASFGECLPSRAMTPVGVFVALSAPHSRQRLQATMASDDAGALFVGGQEHRYGVPLDPFLPRTVHVVVEDEIFSAAIQILRKPPAGCGSPWNRAGTVYRQGQSSENQVVFTCSAPSLLSPKTQHGVGTGSCRRQRSLGRGRLAGKLLKGPLFGRIERGLVLTRNMAETAVGARTGSRRRMYSVRRARGKNRRGAL